MLNSDVYSRLGVAPIINGSGHLTVMGGSIMHREVVAAMEAASNHYVSLPALLERAGERIADLIGVESAFITSGAAAGIAVSVAACLAGTDDAAIRRLPTWPGKRNEVIMQVIERNYYELMIRLAGASVVEVGMAAGKYRWPFPDWHLESAITENTAAIMSFPVYQTQNSLPIDRVIAIARERNVPVIVDAADDYPRFAGLRSYSEMGAQLTIVSGGKGLRGPQSTGLILGDAELIRACAANANPIHGVGRPMKVGKEEIAGIVRAVELASDASWEEEFQSAIDRRAKRLFERLAEDLDASWAVERVPFHNGYPHIHLKFPLGSSITPTSVTRRLMSADHPISVEATSDKIVVHVNTLEDGEEEIVADSLVAAIRGS